MAKNREQDQTFESSLSSLEQIVAQLESGDLPLERALKLFEEGVSLARHCQAQLEDAERKVEMLLRERGEIKVVPFDVPKDVQMSNSETSAALSAVNAANDEPGNNNNSNTEDDLDDSVPF